MAGGSAVYGVTTGFGRLANVRIAPADAAQLQVNLVRSHAVGSGPPLPDEVVRGMLLLLGALAAARALGRARRAGRAGARAARARRRSRSIPSKGSVGSSGDLAPLAHLALVLIGEGEATFGGETLPAARGARAARASRPCGSPPRRASR